MSISNNTNNSKPNSTLITQHHYKNDLIISYYLLKHCKLWVWDFDDTLIDTKYYYKTSMEPNAIQNRTDKELDKEVPQWRYFKRLVQYLIQHGKRIAIASFGTYEIIKAYMDRIMGFNQTFFNKSNLIAPIYNDRTCRGFKFPPNKNEYIYKLMKLYKIEDYKSVVLFDDLPSNIGDAIGIGIIGIQIATPSNGDKVYNSGGVGSGGTDGNSNYGSGGVSYSGGNMFFGPWVMINFDKKIKNDCGKELYLNRTYTGITNKYSNDNKTSYTGLSYDKINFRNGIKEDFASVAFGTGIGNRKISTNPEYRWNKTNVANPPKWINGNWESKKDENWADATLGGESVSFWDKYHSVNKKKETNDKNEKTTMDNDDAYTYENIKPIHINPYNNKLNEPSNQVMGISEGFENVNVNVNEKKNENTKCGICNKFEWNWIVLSLIIIIISMILIIYNVM